MDEDKQEAVDSILRALSHRFDDIPADLSDHLSALDIDAVDGLWEVAFDAKSMSDVLIAVTKATG